MRAQPRRRKEVKDEPIFLRKTYEMINSCEDEHAAWTAAGDTFVIKDPDRFANEVIPRFFKRELKHFASTATAVVAAAAILTRYFSLCVDGRAISCGARAPPDCPHVP